jgi:hypothetical protein
MRCQIFSKAGLFFYLITLSFVSAAATESNINCTEIFISSEEEQPNLDNIEIIFYTDSAQKNFVGDDPSAKLNCIDGLCAKDENYDGYRYEYRDYLTKSWDFSSDKPIYSSRSIFTEIDVVTKITKQQEFNGQVICESELPDVFVAIKLPNSITSVSKNKSSSSGYEISRISSCLMRLEKYAELSRNMFDNLPPSYQSDFAKGYLFAAIPNFYETLNNFRNPYVTDDSQNEQVNWHLETSNAWFDAMDCARDLTHYGIMKPKKY